MEKVIFSLLAVTFLFIPGWTQNSDGHSTAGEQLFMAHVDEGLILIEKSAKEQGISGVAVMAYIPGDLTNGWTSKMKVVGSLANAKVNFASIAYSKISEMAVTLQDSGIEERKNIRGEYGYQGGVIIKVASGYLLACFSGGTGQEDYDAAKIGIDKLSTYF